MIRYCLAIFFVGLIFLSCADRSNLRVTADGFTSKESIKYGAKYKTSAIHIEKEDIDRLKIRLYNSLADTNPTDRVRRWEEIEKLSGNNLFAFILKTDYRIIPEFLDFTFTWDNKPIELFMRSYAVTLSGRTNQRISSGMSWNNSSFYFYPIDTRPYVAYPMVSSTSYIDLDLEDSYLFLFMIPQDSLLPGSHILRVVSPMGGMIDFEWKN
ncbi:hypothetical protein [Leptospira sp. GIMC2001]|uniref:hypothetical protein n=1 Tax=Leptospira sp. GIMC2001 TaxID=1513297 RepID=UPI0023498F71|nr:hypothetical protein [Leptospira sp. GIMC2001]WCL48576.1 hypothetical protein O4O04_14875 [Leptospira sp. GIMC2001]